MIINLLFPKFPVLSTRSLKFHLILGLLMVNVLAMQAQTLVRGVVRESEENVPLPSANVFVEGTQTGTIKSLCPAAGVQSPSMAV